MKRIGIIELTPTSITLALNEVEDDGYFNKIDELTTSIRLFEDLIDGKCFSKEKISETLSTLRAFKSMCEISGVKKIMAFATEAFKVTSNSDKLLNIIKDELNIDITILDSYKEIYYNFLSISNTIYFENSLIVDIEGTSTHLAWVKNGEIQNYYSIPVGTLNLTLKYNLQDIILREDLEAAKIMINKLIDKCTWLKYADFDSIIGIGNTIKILGKIDRIKKRYPIDIQHNYVLYDIDVHDIYNLLKCKNLKQRSQIPGLPCDRADIMVAGVCIFLNLLNHTNVNKIITSARGLKDGIMYEYIAKNYEYEKNMLIYSILGIMNKLNINKSHANNVYKLCKDLFESLKPIHKLDDSFNRILITSSLLHDCGTSIDYYNHHKHSFYIILNSSINGLTQKELLMSAAIAAYHRNNKYSIPFPQYSSIINRNDINAIEYIGTILKIAEGLDRSLEGAVSNINVYIDEESVKLELQSSLDLEVEISQAMRSACSFREIYNRNLIIEKIN